MSFLSGQPLGELRLRLHQGEKEIMGINNNNAAAAAAVTVSVVLAPSFCTSLLWGLERRGMLFPRRHHPGADG